MTFAQRLRRCLDRWEQTLTFFCVIFAAAIGAVFILHVWQSGLNVGSYAIYGRWWLALLGIIYIALSLYAALYPEYEGRYALISVVSSSGLWAAIFGASIVGIVLWAAALVTVGGAVLKRMRDLRRELDQ